MAVPDPEKHNDRPEDEYRYYYVEHLNLVGRVRGENVFFSEVYQPGSGWVRDVNHDISDRILGYDPSEEPGWRMGNTDIMEEIRSISREEAMRLISERV